MKQKIENLISFLQSRSETLTNEFSQNSDISGLTTEQSRDVKIHKIGEAQGLNLCVLAIQKFLLNEESEKDSENPKSGGENGSYFSDNWMLDDVINTCHKFWDNKYNLINQLTIQKIEYARLCIFQFIVTKSTIQDWNKNVDDILKKKIIELGGEPKEFNF